MPLTVAQVAERLGRPGRPANASRVYSWVRVGVVPRARRGEVRGGVRVKLRAQQLPSGMVFEEADVEAFVAALGATSPAAAIHVPAHLIGTYPRPARMPKPLSPAARGRAVRLVPVARTRAG